MMVQWNHSVELAEGSNLIFFLQHGLILCCYLISQSHSLPLPNGFYTWNLTPWEPGHCKCPTPTFQWGTKTSTGSTVPLPWNILRTGRALLSMPAHSMQLPLETGKRFPTTFTDRTEHNAQRRAELATGNDYQMLCLSSPHLIKVRKFGCSLHHTNSCLVLALNLARKEG